MSCSERIPDERTRLPFPGKAISVGELTGHIKELLETDSLLGGLWVQGEVSNLVKAASGHCYFTLKDEKAVIKAALWAGVRRRIRMDFKNGDHVQIYGSISVYEPRGEYQIIAADLRAAGLGTLYEAFEKLKKKLLAEGLFDPARKIPLPFLPAGIGIVTSPKGAVVQDIFRVVRRRFPNMPLFLVPSKVQGEGAAAEIVAGINRLNSDPRVDVIIIARGGGSLEDLWAFNEESVARALAAATKPVVSAIGHETDTTIADMVADKRAATPSVAGELVVPVKSELLTKIMEISERLTRSMKNRLALARQRLAGADACRFLKNPSLLVAERRMRVANMAKDLEIFFQKLLARTKHQYELAAARLTAACPTRLLERGFIMATDQSGKVISEVGQIACGDKLNLQFCDGIAIAGVESIERYSAKDN